MQIQKAEMKFVSFDAQDVITTSGWVGLGMYAPLSLVSNYNEQYAKDGGNSFGFLAGNYGASYAPNVKIIDAEYRATKPLKREASEWNLDMYTDNGITYRQAKTLTDILDWLSENNIQ